MSSPWPADHIEMLVQFWAQGFTATQVALAVFAKTGTLYSRSAVCGKVDRLKLPTRKSDEDFKRRPIGAPRARRADAVMKEIISLPEPEFLGPLNDFPPRGTCRYIKGDVGKTNWQACGHPAMSGRSWCRWHWGVVFQPAARVKAVAMPEQVAA